MADPIPLRNLAYSILVGPIVWAVHFVVVYMVADLGCRANFVNLQFVTPATIRLVVLALTLPALLLVGAGGILAYRARQPDYPDDEIAPLEERNQFLIWTGMLLSALFLLAILATAAPALIVNVCDWAA